MICGWFKTTQCIKLDFAFLEFANICIGVSRTHEEMGLLKQQNHAN